MDTWGRSSWGCALGRGQPGRGVWEAEGELIRDEVVTKASVHPAETAPGTTSEFS